MLKGSPFAISSKTSFRNIGGAALKLCITIPKIIQYAIKKKDRRKLLYGVLFNTFVFMNLNELRIGNYIQLISSKSITKVSGIFYAAGEKSMYEKPVLDTFSHGLNHPSSYEGITLTSEWLVKFGFKQTKFMEKGNPIFHIGDGFYDVVLNPTEFSDFYFRIYENYRVQPIKFVHQLQNLYFTLMNQELKINKSHVHQG
jgi:hypothetical protein